MYFRAGYGPGDYPTDQVRRPVSSRLSDCALAIPASHSAPPPCTVRHAGFATAQEWAARRRIELSMAIKCPTVAYQLAGTKKVQQVVARSGVLERFLSPDDAKFMRTCFTGLYPLDDSVEGRAALNNALAHPAAYVLKPQREGGGRRAVRTNAC